MANEVPFVDPLPLTGAPSLAFRWFDVRLQGSTNCSLAVAIGVRACGCWDGHINPVGKTSTLMAVADTPVQFVRFAVYKTVDAAWAV